MIGFFFKKKQKKKKKHDINNVILKLKLKMQKPSR